MNWNRQILRVAATLAACSVFPEILVAAPCTRAQTVTTPCEGVLLPGPAAQSGLQCLRVDLPSCRESVRYNEERLALEATRLNGLLTAEREKSHRLDQLLVAAQTPVVQEPPGWYEHPALWFAVGVLAGGAGAVAAVHYSR